MIFSSAKNPGLENYIPEGSEINGNLKSASNLRIEGKVEGKVVLDGDLILENSGRIIGDVECGNAQIAGIVEGNIYTSTTLELRSGSKISGNIVTARIILEEGCQFGGTMKLNK